MNPIMTFLMVFGLIAAPAATTEIAEVTQIEEQPIQEVLVEEPVPVEVEDLYTCDGNYTERIYHTNVVSCNKNFMDLVRKYMNESESYGVVNLYYGEYTGTDEAWIWECNGAFWPMKRRIDVYTCGKDQYVMFVGDLDKNQNIEFTFLHELGHAVLRVPPDQNGEPMADEWAKRKMGLI